MSLKAWRGVIVLVAAVAAGSIAISRSGNDTSEPTPVRMDTLDIQGPANVIASVLPTTCTSAPGWPLMTAQQFDAPVGQGKRDSAGWIEEQQYSPRAQYVNGTMIGTWRKGLKGGTGPWNIGFHVQNVTDMYSCIRVRLESGMTIPNNGLKHFFWHSRPVPGKGNVNHVGMWRLFPRVSGQFPQQTGPDGFHYTTTEYCGKIGDAGTKQDHSVYSVRPTRYIDLRDSQFHTYEYTITGGTPGKPNGAIEVRLDGVIVCAATAVRWYAPNMSGRMYGNDFNPNSSAGGNSTGPVKCPRPVGGGNAAWCTTEIATYDFVYAEGR